MPISFLSRAVYRNLGDRGSQYHDMSDREIEQRLFLKNGVIYSKDSVQKFRESNIINVTLQVTLEATLMNPINLWLLFLMLFYFTFDDYYDKPSIILSLELALNFGISLYRSYLDNVRLQQDSGRIQNYKQGKYLKLSQNLISQIALSSLRVGDLVYFKRGQTVPLNVLILDSKDDDVKLQVWRGSGQTSFLSRWPVKLTRVMNQGKVSENLAFYKQIMNGKLTFNASQLDNDGFTGYIKLQKDPKGESLSIQNIIPKNTQILNSDWVIGMSIENIQHQELKRFQKFVSERSSRFFSKYILRVLVLYAIIWLPCLFVLITSHNGYWQFLSEFAFSSIEPGLIQFFIELMSYNIGSKNSRVEKLSALTKPCTFVYTKTGTMTFPKIYLDGIICQNHFFQVQGKGSFNKNLSLIQSPQMKKVSSPTAKSSKSKKERKLEDRLRKYETPYLGDGGKPLDKKPTFQIHEVPVDPDPVIADPMADPQEYDAAVEPAITEQMFSLHLQPSQIGYIDLEQRNSDEKIDIPCDSEAFLSDGSVNTKRAIKTNNYKMIQRMLKKKEAKGIVSPHSQTLPEETVNSQSHNHYGHQESSKGEVVTFQHTFHVSDKRLESDSDIHYHSRKKPMLQEASLHSSSDDEDQQKYLQYQYRSQDMVFNNLMKSYHHQQSQGLLKLDNKKRSTVNYRRLTNIGEILRKGELELHSFFISLILCHDLTSKIGYTTLESAEPIPLLNHNIRSRSIGSLNSNMRDAPKSVDYSSKRQLHQEHTESFQESILKFAKIHDFEFISSGMFRNRKCYEINVKGIRERFYIIMKSPYNVVKNQFWIILEKHQDKVRRGQRQRESDAGKNRLVFYLKSEDPELINQSDISEFDCQRLRTRLSYMSTHGYRFLFYYTKQIFAHEVTNTEEQLFANMSFMGICCLKEQVKEESCAIFQGLKRMNMHQWLLTLDPLNGALSCLFQNGLIGRESNIIYIKDAKDEEQLKYFIKSNLLYIRKLMMVENFEDQDKLEQKFTSIFKKQNKPQDDQFEGQGVNDLCLFLDGNLLETILNDDYLRTHVMFLIMISKIFVGYNFTLGMRKKLIGEFKSLQERSTLVALSNGINDQELVELADFSFLVKPHTMDEQIPDGVEEHMLNLNQSYETTEHTLHDFKVSSWQQLIDYVFQGSKRITFYSHHLVVAVMKFSVSTLLMLSTYQFTFKSVEEFKLLEQIFIMLSFLVGFNQVVDIQKLERNEKILMLLPYSRITPKKGTRPWISHFMCQVLLYNIFVVLLYTINVREIFYDTYGQFIPCDVDVPLVYVMIQLLLTSQIIARQLFFIKKRIIKILSFLGFQTLSFVFYCSLKSDFQNDIYFFVMYRSTILKSENLLLVVDCFMVSVFFVLLFDWMRLHLFLTKSVRHLLQYFEENLSLHSSDGEWLCAFPRLADYIPPQQKRDRKNFTTTLQKIFKNVVIDPFIKPMLETKLYDESFLYSNSTLKFVSTMLEKRYVNLKLSEYQWPSRLFNFLVLTFFYSYHLAYVDFYSPNIYSLVIVQLILIGFHIVFLVIISAQEEKKNKKFKLYNRQFELNFLIPFFTMLIIAEQNYNSLNFYIFMLMSLYLSWDIFYPPFTLNAVLQFVRLIILLSVQSYSNSMVFGTLLSQSIHTLLLCVIIRYQGERLGRKVFQQKQLLELQQEQTTDLLKLLLPEFVHERMEDGGENATDEGDVTVIFIEICKFESIVKSKNRHIVHFLDEIFRGFDRLCLEHNIQKIETVGKVYMACIGLRSLSGQIRLQKESTFELSDKSTTQVAIEFSFAIMKASESFNYESIESGREEKLKLKIGIHFGRVLSGVIGYHKPQFSLIGDTVNTSSRVCSNCDEGKVTISRQAYEEVSNSPFLFKEKIIKAKGKGDLKVYEAYKREINLLKLRRHSMNDMVSLLTQCTDPELATHYKKFVPYYDMPNDIGQYNGNIQSSFSVSLPASKTNILFLNSRRNTTKKPTDISPGRKVKFNQNTVQHQPLTASVHLRNMNDTTRRPNGRLNSQKRQSVLSQKKRSIVVSSKSNNNSYLTGSLMKSVQSGLALPETKEAHTESSPKVKVIEQGVSSERVQSRWKTIHLDRMQQGVNTDHETDDDGMQLAEVDAFPEFRNNKSIHKDSMYHKAQTTFEGKSTLPQNRKHLVSEYSKLTLQFLQKNLHFQGEFDKYFVDNMAERQNKFLIILVSSQVMIIILELYHQYNNNTLQQQSYYDEGTLFFSSMCFYLLPKSRFRSPRMYKILTQMFYTLMCLGYAIVYMIHGILESNLTMVTITIAIAINQQAFTFLESLLYITGNSIIWIILLGYKSRTMELFFLLNFSLFLLMTSYRNFERHLIAFTNTLNYNSNRQQKDALITNLLPSHILTKFYEDNKIKVELSDILPNATLLFADIAGFTAYSAAHQAEEVVNMLKHLMTEFDKLCLEHTVYKVYTIGDCYVVLGVNDIEKRNPGKEAQNVMNMALKMVDIIQNVRRKINFMQLNMRIGMHTGEYLGGVVGTDIVRYDIFGVDVLVANKMESNGEPGRVMISEDTKVLLESQFPDKYIFTYNTEVFISAANRNVKTYFAEHNDEESYA